MTLSSQPCATISLATRARLSVLFVCAAVLLTGCPPEQKRPAFQWKTAAVTRPIIPQPLPDTQRTLPEVTSVAEVAPPPTLRIVPPRGPARPRVPTVPGTTVENNGKSEGPLIVPQMSAQESAAAQQEINTSLAAAEKNLESVRGRSLNGAQSDMANKAKGFVNDAREAARSGDWPRARSLARKALVLAEELARSF